ncbi:MAG: glycosyltransferase [Gammaproteobacteria bacterium]|nr:glycosyltransferase [Gammaproteobacteria bacterium]
MKILCVFGEHNYGNPERGKSYEYSNFLPALRALGHEVVHFESWNKSEYSDFLALNQTLLQRVGEEAPDVILFVIFSYEIWVDTLCAIRRISQARLVNWSTDDSWRFDQLSRLIAPYFDLYVTTYESAVRKAESLGYANFHLSQWAAPGDTLSDPVPARDCEYTVSFIGTAYGDRERLIDRLVKDGVSVECFGYGWPNGAVSFTRMREIIRDSVISLNFTDPGSKGWFGRSGEKQIKARLFEVPGLGGFVLTERAPGLEKYFVPDREVAVFEGPDGLSSAVRRILDDVDWRDRLALAGHERVAREHTYESRFADILDTPARRPGERSIDTPVEAWKRLHRMTPALTALKWMMVLPLIPIFGPRRARRAVRRLVYGLSWRLAGVRTYSARGLPGRMFYADS